MYPQRSARPTNSSTKTLQRSPSPNKLIQRKSMSRRQRNTGLKKSKPSNGDNSTHKETGHDLLDIINSTQSAGKSVEVQDNGLDDSDDSSSSVASGPSLLSKVTPKTVTLCSTCQNLYKKAKRMKAPLKDKLLDNDPKSLTCDQWVLIKIWRPKHHPDTKGKLLTHVTLVKRRLRFKNGAMRIDQRLNDGESSACSRPHVFLQRNLRQQAKLLKRGMKKNSGKRRRERSQGSTAAKQRRLNHQHSSTSNISSHDPTSVSSVRSSSSPALEGCSDQEIDDLAVKIIPCSVRLERAISITQMQNPAQAKKKKAAKARGGFSDLLNQLRGNSSMIVRETR